MTKTGICNGCGRRLPAGHPVGDRCEKCPPWLCPDCGLMDSMQNPCSCWVNVSDLAFADLKGLFASSDLGLGTPRE